MFREYSGTLRNFLSLCSSSTNLPVIHTGIYMNEIIEEFFKQYVGRFNKSLYEEDADVDGTARSFADYFIEANPIGVNCGQNDKHFRAVIPQGYAFYKGIGITSMEIVSQKITQLDSCHAMDRIVWRSGFTRKDGTTGTLDFEIIYLLQIINEECKIFAYITGDEKQALKENGLIS
jgi:hypothetical protein